MLAYLSDEWLAAVQRAADGDLSLTQATADLELSVEQRVTGTPRGDIVFHVVLDHGASTFGSGPLDDPDVVFTQSYDVAAQIGRKDLSAQAAFMVGRIKVSGRIDRLHAAAAGLDKVNDVFGSVRASTEY